VSIGGGYHGAHAVLGIHSRLTGLQKLPLDCPAEDLQAGDIIHLETPINPTGDAYDIAYYAEKAHSSGALLVVDSTLGPPPLQDPFAHGADVVIHSGTKYFGGHSDL
jgi:cystathionine beta-lyase/cystathionine gamma-synthase